MLTDLISWGWNSSGQLLCRTRLSELALAPLASVMGSPGSAAVAQTCLPACPSYTAAMYGAYLSSLTGHTRRGGTSKVSAMWPRGRHKHGRSRA